MGSLANVKNTRKIFEILMTCLDMENQRGIKINQFKKLRPSFVIEILGYGGLKESA